MPDLLTIVSVILGSCAAILASVVACGKILNISSRCRRYRRITKERKRRRSARAAKGFFRKLLKGLRMVPHAIVTDRLASYVAAKAVVMPTVSHLRGWRQNNRVENSHQPVRQRERGLQRFKSLRHAARFCSVFSTVCNHFRPGRHALSAPNYRRVMKGRWREWDVVSETAAFAIAA